MRTRHTGFGDGRGATAEHFQQLKTATEKNDPTAMANVAMWMLGERGLGRPVHARFIPLLRQADKLLAASSPNSEALVVRRALAHSLLAVHDYRAALAAFRENLREGHRRVLAHGSGGKPAIQRMTIETAVPRFDTLVSDQLGAHRALRGLESRSRSEDVYLATAINELLHWGPLRDRGIYNALQGIETAAWILKEDHGLRGQRGWRSVERSARALRRELFADKDSVPELAISLAQLPGADQLVEAVQGAAVQISTSAVGRNLTLR